MQTTTLVTGGAGYIGSHMVKMLAQHGYRVIVLDNLSTGCEHSARFGELIIGDLADKQLLRRLFREYNFDSVMHFAGAALVNESVTNPKKYYRANVSATLNLLEALVEYGVNNLVFSSTAAVYGEPTYIPIDEQHPKNPVNPYGKSKLMVERCLEDYWAAYGLSSVSFRYFNACGADPQGLLGEMHEPETHIIPLILQVALNRRKSVSIYGTDHPTQDGTCVRDYVHVWDICRAHLLAMQKMLSKKLVGAHALNLGSGQPYSVKELIEAAREIVSKENREIKVLDAPKRNGDPSILVADSNQSLQLLDWVPQYGSISIILNHAWEWEKTKTE